MLSVDRHLVCLDRAGTGIGDNLAFGAQMVPDPVQPGLANTQHSRCRAQGLLHLINRGG